MGKMKKGKKYLLLTAGLITVLVAANLIFGYGMRRTAIERQYFPLPDGFEFAGYRYFAGDIKAVLCWDSQEAYDKMKTSALSNIDSARYFDADTLNGWDIRFLKETQTTEAIIFARGSIGRFGANSVSPERWGMLFQTRDGTVLFLSPDMQGYLWTSREAFEYPGSFS